MRYRDERGRKREKEVRENNRLFYMAALEALNIVRRIDFNQRDSSEENDRSRNFRHEAKV